MKRTTQIATLILGATFAFGASAAELITSQQAKEMKLEMLGTVTTTSTNAPLDARADLSKKADEKGGKYYVIIAANERDRTVATAEVYK